MGTVDVRFRRRPHAGVVRWLSGWHAAKVSFRPEADIIAYTIN
jgi:hypothetical protein